MQQVGPSAFSCLELAQQLIEDFVMFQKTCCDQLKSLPMVAPRYIQQIVFVRTTSRDTTMPAQIINWCWFGVFRFAVNFMTSVCGLYFKESGGNIASPPDTLIELFTDWLVDSPRLCTETHPVLELLSGAIPMPLIPPIEGLISWCTLSPLFLPMPDLHYSKLNLALLQSLSQVWFCNYFVEFLANAKFALANLSDLIHFDDVGE